MSLSDVAKSGKIEGRPRFIDCQIKLRSATGLPNITQWSVIMATNRAFTIHVYAGMAEFGGSNKY